MGTTGADAIELCARVGVYLDPWQRLSLQSIMWEDEAGKWASYEAALLLARQNGKGEVLMGRELYGLFVIRENLMIHSAHEFKTADEAFRRIRQIIENNDDLSSRVKRMNESHGEEGVELLPNATIIIGSGSSLVRQSTEPRLRFLARSGGSGRGFTADTVIWDEAYNLPVATINAQQPMLSAVENPQLIYASSAVDQKIHNYGHALAAVRQRALRAILSREAEAPAPVWDEEADDILQGCPPGTYEHDDEPSLCWLEWQGDEARWHDLSSGGKRRLMRAFTNEPEQWQAANPAMGFRLSVEKTSKEARSMTPGTFAVERLNIGDWPRVEDDSTTIDMDRWDDIGDETSRPIGKIALALEVTPDRKWACIASAGSRSDDRHHTKIVDHRMGTHWVIERLLDLKEAYEIVAIVIDPASAAGALIEPLVTAGILEKIKGVSGRHIVRVTARDVAQACGTFFDEVQPKSDMLRHCDQDNLTDALQEATTRPLSDAWAWSRKTGTDISPLMAATLALHGWRTYGRSGTMPWASRG